MIAYQVKIDFSAISVTSTNVDELHDARTVWRFFGAVLSWGLVMILKKISRIARKKVLYRRFSASPMYDIK